MRGNLILIEGLDRSGKSTQVANLSTAIPNSKVLKFPDRSTSIGKIIDDYLQNKIDLPDQSIHLLFCANRWELYKSMIDDLESGMTIILDRYIYSGISYSLAKLSMNNITNEMASLEWLYYPDTGLPKPDLTIFLTLDIEEIKKRSQFGNERYENTELQTIVKKNFLSLLDPTTDSSISLLDVNGKSIEDVKLEIWKVIEEGNFNVPTLNKISFLGPDHIIKSSK